MIDGLLRLALAGGAATLVWWAVHGAARGRLPARWDYRLLKLALACSLLPVGRWVSRGADLLARGASGVPPALPGPTVLPPAVSPGPGAALGASPAALSLSPEALGLLTLLWALGALGTLAWKLAAYLRFRRLFLRRSRPVEDPAVLGALEDCRRRLGLRTQVAVRTDPRLPGPMVTGLLRPTVLLPALPLPAEDLRCLLLHELTHVQAHDLWVRLFSLAGLVLHWYSPLMHLVHRSIPALSEQSCDERAAEPLSPAERRAYGHAILRLALRQAAGGEWAAPLSAGEALERRLMRVLHAKKLTGPRRLAALLAAAAILTAGTAAALAVGGPLVGTAAEEPPAPAVSAPAPAPSAPSPTPSAPAPRDPAPNAPDPNGPAPDTGDGGPRTVPAETPADPVPAETPEDAGGTPGAETIGTPETYWGLPAGVPPDGTEVLVPSGEQAAVIDYLCQRRGLEHADLYVRENGDGTTLVGVYRQSTRLQAWAEQYLIDGAYPQNSRGETYGPDALSAVTGQEPDLVSAQGTHGEKGYIRRADIDALPELPEADCPHERTIPLYDAEGAVIGEFPVGCGGHFPGGLTKEEVKAALAAG